MSVFFPSSPRRDIAMPFDPEQRWMPELYPDTARGSTIVPPQNLGFWGVTMRDKQIISQIQEPQNVLTWIGNNVIDPLLPGEQHYVTMGAAQRWRQAFDGEVEDGWDHVLGRLHSPPATTDVGAIKNRLEFRDPDFDADEQTNKYLASESTAIELGLIEKYTGRNMADLLRSSRNLEHWEFQRRLYLQEAVSQSRMQKWEEDAGWGLKWTSRATSAIGNYVLTDPSFAPSLFIPFGGTQAAATRIGARVAVSAKRIGDVASRSGVRMTMHVPSTTSPISGIREASRLAARGIRDFSAAPEAMHRGLATVLSHRGAVATEMAGLGVMHSAAWQSERIDNSLILTDDPAYQESFHWDELGMAAGIGTALGFVLGGRAGHVVGRRSMVREAMNEAAGGTASSPIRYSFDNVAGQGELDWAAIRAKRAAEKMLGKNHDVVAPYVLNDELLMESGLDRAHMARVLEELSEAAQGEPMSDQAILRVLADELSAAHRARKGFDALDDAIGSQFEKEALANAVGRAARENPSLKDDALMTRAKELVPEELDKVTARHEERVVRARKRGTSEQSRQFWVEEAKLLREAARLRPLLRHELEYLARVEGKLEALGEARLTRGLRKARADRYENHSAMASFGNRRQSPVTNALRKVRKEKTLIEEARAAGDTQEVSNAQARLRRAQKRLAREAKSAEAPATPQETSRRLQEAIAKANRKTVRTQAEADKALGEVFDALGPNTGMLMEDHTEMGKLLNAFGIGGLLKRVARSGLGYNETFKSNLNAIRFIAQELDHAKLMVDDLDPTSDRVHRTVQQLLEDMKAVQSEFLDTMRKYDQAGEFGNWWKNPRGYNQRREAFEKETILHIVDPNFTSDNPRVREIADLWKKHAGRIRQEGIEAGVFTEKTAPEVFFPRRWNSQKIMSDQSGFRRAIANFFLRHWKDSDEVHLGTLEAMGKATREVDPNSLEYVGHRILIDGEEQVVRTLQRSDLEKLEVEEAAYLRALETPDEATGFTPMETSANRVKENLTNANTFEELPDGRLRRVSGNRGPRSEQSRMLEDSVWLDSDIQPYLDFRFLDNSIEYLRGTGLRVSNRLRHQKRLGIQNISMHQTLEFIERRFARMMSNMDAPAEERRAFETAIRELRQKVHLVEGRLPSVKEDVEGVRQWTANLFTNTAGALFGQGIGSTIVSTELLQSTLSKTYGITDIIRRPIQAFRAGAHLVGDTTGIKMLQNDEMRSQMVSLGLTQRQFRNFAMDRMLGEQTYNHGYHLRSTHKLIAPWKEALDYIMGHGTQHGLQRRLTNSPLVATRALAFNMMQIGALDFFSMWARLMHVQTTMNEAGRFFRAAEKMADDLANPTTRRALDEAEASGGVAQRFKVWKGIARRAGFTSWYGADNWQVAERFQRAGLLDKRRLTALRRSGGVLDDSQGGTAFRTLDWEKIQNYVPQAADETAAFEEATTGLRDLINEILRKRVSEQSIVQTPTTQLARTPLGKVHNSMTTWTRSFFDNNITDASQMPIRIGASMLAVFLFGETINQIMREMWNGKSLDDIEQDIMDDKNNFVARSLTQLPWLGQFGGWTRFAADALTKDDRIWRSSFGGSAATGAMAQVFDFGADVIRSAIDDDQTMASRSWRTLGRFMPGYRTWWGLAANDLLEKTTGMDLIADKDPRGNRYRDTLNGTLPQEHLPLPFKNEPQLKPDVPEDLGFLYDTERD